MKLELRDLRRISGGINIDEVARMIVNKLHDKGLDNDPDNDFNHVQYIMRSNIKLELKTDH